MNLKRHLCALVAAVLLGGGLVGCAVGDEWPVPYEPQVADTPKPKETDDTGVDDGGTDESGSDLEALEPPPIPDAIYEGTLEGAEAAAQYYVDVFNYGYATFDSAPLKAFAHKKCGTCAMHIESTDEYRDLNAERRGGTVHIISDYVVLNTLEGEVIIGADAVQDPYETFSRSGERLSSYEGSDGFLTMAVKFIDSEWRIRAIIFETEDD